MTSTLVIRNLRAVGMHHHCPSKQLRLGQRYTAEWEPDCPHDLGNAVAIVDHGRRVRAYLARADAAIVSKLFCGEIVEGKMYCVTRVLPHVEVHNLGPQQECTVQCSVLDVNKHVAQSMIQELDFICQ